MKRNMIPERLIAVRESLGLNKAEAAKLLDLSKMGYGRYERGERQPSPQTLEVIAQKFQTSVDYLTGETSSAKAETIVVELKSSKELFTLVEHLQKEDGDMLRRLLAYYDKISKKNGKQ